MANSSTSIGILGGGITGLTISWWLNQQGIDSTLYENSDTPGGAIATRKQNGWLWEAGPNTLKVRSKQVWQLFQKVGLEDRICHAHRNAQKRYVVRDGKLLPLPLSLGDFIRTDLFSLSAKFRMFKEPFVSPSNQADESVADFFGRRLGEEVLDYVVNPFVAGIYAGNPRQLSFKHTFPELHRLEQQHGSLAMGMFNKGKSKSVKQGLISFKGGLQTLPNTMSKQLGRAVRFNRTVSGIRRRNDRWSVTFEKEGEVSHDILISTLPLHLITDLWEDHPGEANPLDRVYYAPMAVAALGYRKEQVDHPLDGFGMLVPEKEKYTLLGTLFSSSLFPDRAPGGHVLLTCFAGGARNPDIARLPADELIPRIQIELDQLLGVSGTPVFSDHIAWDQAIPQYEIGYREILAAIQQLEQNHPGLFLAGSYRGGVSVPDCISNGIETAEKVALLING